MLVGESFPNIPIDEKNPLTSKHFFKVLKESKAIGYEKGWEPIFFSNSNSMSAAFIKDNSFGEFIFDWQWAQAYERHGLTYYPKLTHAIAFTPVNAPKIIGGSLQSKTNLAKDIFNYYEQSSNKSHHYLFTTNEENQILEEIGYSIRYSLQYHWTNQWKSFDDFLESLKKNRRKSIKQERKKIERSDLLIKEGPISELSTQEIEDLYLLYLSTINKKFSNPYLNRQTFIKLKEHMPQEVIVQRAFKEDELIAMSLMISSKETLYGRYWGIKREYEGEYPFLHFELCYYRGIDYCLKNKVNKFEAGAQGEQKLLRGFKPIIITSAHHFKNFQFNVAIRNFIEEERNEIIKIKENCEKYLPYKTKNNS